MDQIGIIIALFIVIFIIALCAGISKDREMKDNGTAPDNDLPRVAITRHVPDPFRGFGRKK